MNKYDKKHLTNLTKYGKKVDKIYKEAIKQAAKFGVNLHGFNPDKPFAFDDYPIVKKKADKLVEWLHRGLTETITDGVHTEWALSNSKNDTIVDKALGASAWRLPNAVYNRYYNTNGAAEEAFLARKISGLDLSDNVWKYSNRFKDEIELGLDLGIRSGRSADQISRDIRLWLQHPDKLFRKVKTDMIDSEGNPIWKLSKAAEIYHPGRGVYRSSYKNARRLAVTETNMAYRTADHERWQQLDFVIGQRVLLSNNHTINDHPLEDICDDLSGKEGDTSVNRTADSADISKLGMQMGKGSNRKGFYPKDFKFTGWHPLCRCHVVPVMLTPDEIKESTQAMLNGEEYTPERKPITEMPKEYKEWKKDNAVRIEKALNNRTAPDFVLSAKAVEEKSVRKTALEIAKERHAARTPEQIADIKRRAEERRATMEYHHMAINGALELLAQSGYKSYDTTEIKDLLTRGKLQQSHAKASEMRGKIESRIYRTAGHIRARANKLGVDYAELENALSSDNVISIREQTLALAKKLPSYGSIQSLGEVIPNVHEWIKKFKFSELQAVHDAVAQKLASWAHLSLAEQAKKLQFEAVDFLGGNMHNVQVKYATWEVSQAAYLKRLKAVNKEIALKHTQDALVAAQKWLAQHPHVKNLKKYLADVQQAIADGEELSVIQEKASIAINEHALKLAKEAKEAHKTSSFGASAFTKKRKNAAMWAQDTKDADDRLREVCGNVWQNATKAEKEAIYGYTGSYHNIQEPLRGILYTGSAKNAELGLQRIPLIESIIDKSTYDFDMWLQRGDGMIALKKFGLSNYNTATDEEIQALVGKTGTEGGFWSTGVAKGKGFSGDIIFNIYAPKGTRAMYCEPFSQYGKGGGLYWNGKTPQASFGYESEMLLQRGTTMRITKVEKCRGQWFIDVEVIKQEPLPFPYVGGYPYL